MFYDVYDLLLCVFVFVFGFIIVSSFRSYFGIKLYRSWALYIWHSIFCIVYASYILKFGGDAFAYYEKSLNFKLGGYAPNGYFGTPAIVKILIPFTNYLSFSFLASCLIFNIFGSIGLVCLDASIKNVVSDSSAKIKQLASLIVFLPSVSFWSSGIGKDAISFMSVCLICWAAMSIKKRFLLLAFSILLMLIVRPHIAGIITIALLCSYVFNRNLPIFTRAFLISISLVCVSFLVPFALKYAGIDGEVSVHSVTDYVDHRQTLNSQGGSSIDISSMSFLEQVFAYLYRPLPFDAHNLTSLQSSLENVFLLMIAILSFFVLLKVKLNNIDFKFPVLFYFSYVIGGLSILASTTANLGIAVRQKWMILPFLLLIFFSILNSYKKGKFNE